jgi:hypothetical protein
MVLRTAARHERNSDCSDGPVLYFIGRSVLHDLEVGINKKGEFHE